MCVVIQRVSFTVFGIMTIWLLGKTGQLIMLSHSKAWFTDAEWIEYYRYPDYAKYLILIQVIALITLIITSRIRKKNH